MPTKIEISSEIVKKYGLDAGAGVVGIAAAKDFSLSPDGCKPSDVLQGCVSVIVLGSPFPAEALSMKPPEYTELRNEIVSKMTDIAKKTAKQIRAVGYKAKEISSTGGKHIEGKYYGHISLKHAAELAGLGVITRNYLLTNPQHGNLLWLSAVLTDIELNPDIRLQFDVCGNCNKCVEVCPSGALDDPDLFGRKECDKFFVIENKKLVIKCFKCRAVCPYRFGMS